MRDKVLELEEELAAMQISAARNRWRKLRPRYALAVSLAAMIVVLHLIVYFSSWPHYSGDTWCGVLVIWFGVTGFATLGSFAWMLD